MLHLHVQGGMDKWNASLSLLSARHQYLFRNVMFPSYDAALSLLACSPSFLRQPTVTFWNSCANFFNFLPCLDKPCSFLAMPSSSLVGSVMMWSVIGLLVASGCQWSTRALPVLIVVAAVFFERDWIVRCSEMDARFANHHESRLQCTMKGTNPAE